MVSAIRIIHIVMVLSWVSFAALEYLNYSDRGSTIGMIFGTFTIAMGLTTLLDPRIQGMRDVDLITSEEVGPAERFGARVGGVVMLTLGMFISWLFWPR